MVSSFNIINIYFNKEKLEIFNMDFIYLIYFIALFYVLRIKHIN